MTALIREAFICVTLFAATLGCMAKEIIVMQIVPLSGPVGAPGTMFAEGASLYFQHVNSKGGINGQRIRHVVLDDKYDADTSLSRLNQTLAEQGTPAALLTFGTASTLAVVAELDRRKLQIPVFPTGSGSTSLRRPFNRNLFHIRAGYANEFAKLIEILATTAVTSFSVVYQDDAFGQDSATVIQKALADHSLPAAVAFRHDRSRQDISNLVAEVGKSSAQVVLLATTQAAGASFIKRAHADKLNKRIVTISDMDPNDLVREVGVHAATGVMLSQSLPDPNSKSRPMVAEYARLVESAGGRIAKNAYTLEGYIQARVIVEGLRRASSGSASSLMGALETLKNLDLGDYFISFSPSSHEGALFVDTAIISSTGRVIR